MIPYVVNTVCLFQMHDACLAVGFETGFLNDVVEVAAVPDLFEGKLRVRLVGRYQGHRSHAEDAVEKAPAHFEIDHPEHVYVVDSPVQDPSAPLDSVATDLVVDHLELEYFDAESKHDQSGDRVAGKHPVITGRQ